MAFGDPGDGWLLLIAGIVCLPIAAYIGLGPGVRGNTLPAGLAGPDDHFQARGPVWALGVAAVGVVMLVIGALWVGGGHTTLH